MSLSFRRPRLEDRQEVKKILEKSGNIDSASAFGTLYLWAEGYNIDICMQGGVLFKKSGKSYGFPRGAENDAQLKSCLEALKQNCLNCKKFILGDLLENDVRELDRIFPGKFSFSKNRDNSEYVYDIKNLAQLSGKKYHSKRNHISKFSKLYSWKYIPCIKNTECMDFFEKWFKIYSKDEEKFNKQEYLAIKKALENFEALELSGGMLEVNGEIIACTIGERINKDALLVHFEKALPEFEGSYSVINNEFCKSKAGNFKFVNREEDMGIPGLRKSKLSYKPMLLLNKYTAVWED